MKPATAEKHLRPFYPTLSRTALLKDVSELNLDVPKTISGENIFRWKHIIQLRYKYQFNSHPIWGKVISVCQNKGGVGKSTSVINLAKALSYIGRVLVIDYDGQANCTNSYNLYPSPDSPTIFTALKNQDEPKKYIYNVGQNLDIMPNHEDFDDWVNDEEKRPDYRILNKLISKVKENYSFILIDNASTLQLSFKMAIYSSDYYLLPFETQPFSNDGIKKIISKVETLKTVYDLDTKLLGIFINKHSRGNLSDQIRESLDLSLNGSNEKKKNHIFKTIVNDSVSIQQSQAMKQSIFEYKEESSAAQDFYNLTFEILERIINNG